MKNLLFTFIMMLGISLNAQNHLTVSGNVGVENVNISVINTEYGTSSDNKGNYKLSLYESVNDIKLLYTCVGYRDSTVTIKPEMFQFDSIEISFKMESVDYELPAAGVTATRDFYRSRQGNVIIDIDFYEDKILILESKKSKTELHFLNDNGYEIAKARYDSAYNEIFTDVFGNRILVGKSSCRHIFIDDNNDIVTVETFSRKTFNDKMQNGMCKFKNAYIFKDKTVKQYDSYVRNDHNKSQTFFFISENDSLHKKQLLYRMLDKEGYKVASIIFGEIVAYYNIMTSEINNEIKQGVWNGNILSLMPDCDVLDEDCKRIRNQVLQYIYLETKSLEIDLFPTDDTLLMFYIDGREVITFNDSLKVIGNDTLIIKNNDFFKNKIISDKITNKIYGLYEKDGLNYIGEFDASSNTINMTTRASNYIYPKVLKINGRYAYGVYFDVGRQRGFINRVKVD